MANEESTIPTSENAQEIPESSLPTTRAKAKAGGSHLVPPLERFSRRGTRKTSHKKKSSHPSSTKSEKDAEGFLSDSQSSVESDPRPVAFPPRRWADYTSSSSADDQMPVMVTEAAIPDNRLQEMTLAIEKLTKALEEKDTQISALMTRLEMQHPGESSQGNTNSSGIKVSDIPDPREKQKLEGHDQVEVQNPFRETASQHVASLSVQQLQQMIADSIRVQYGGSPQSSLVYAKPYTRRVDEIRMPLGYQPPKFQQFDGRGSPKQHVAHFIETCNNAGTYGDSMVKQFVRSLRGAAFDWYTDLPPGSIDSWDQLEREFLTRFYSTRRTVSIPELAQTKQRKDEPVVEYIERWRNLVLNCKERISEASSIDMCVQGMHWGLLYSIKSNMPHSFEELATRAHDLEMQIARHGNQFPSESREKKDGKKEIKKDGKPGKAKEAMLVSTVPKQISINKSISKSNEENKNTKDQFRQKNKRTLKELEEKDYPFPDSEVSVILDQLLEEKLIELPVPKRPEEAGCTNDPKYCRYHRIISHPLEKCFVLKDLIVRLANENKIALEVNDNVATSNVAMISFGSLDPISLTSSESIPTSSSTLLPQSEKDGVFPDPAIPTQGVCNSEVQELTACLPEGAVPVEFIVDGEVTTVYAYPGMPRLNVENRPTLYELMMDDLEDWISSSESEDEIDDRRSTFIRKKKKHQPLRQRSARLPQGASPIGIPPESQFEDSSVPEKDEGWTKVQRRKPRKPQLSFPPISKPDYYWKENKSKSKQGWKSKTEKEISTKPDSEEVESSSSSKEPLTLLDYLPDDFFSDRHAASYTVTTHGNDRSNEGNEEPVSTSENIPSNSDLQGIPSNITLSEVLQLPVKDRLALVDPKGIQENSSVNEPQQVNCMTTITFTDEDLQLGSKLHNRPLYVSGYTRDHKLSRILIDGGSAINIMPIRTMKRIGVTIDELTRSKLIIQGFNQKGQRAIGMIRLKLEIGDMISSTLFHVIDSKTSYELLLGRTWLHETGVVASTLHQCLKYNDHGIEKCVVAEKEPFTVEESHFADAKFYLDEEVYPEAFPRKEAEDIETKEMTDTSKRAMLQLSENDSRMLKEELSLPLPSIVKVLVPNLPEQGNAKSKTSEEPKKQPEGWFDPRVQKLFENAGYGKGEPRQLGNLDTILSHGRVEQGGKKNKMKSPREQKYGLGYQPSAPVKIKMKKASANPIMIQIYECNEKENTKPPASVFDRLGNENLRVSVFDRLGESSSEFLQPESPEENPVLPSLHLDITSGSFVGKSSPFDLSESSQRISAFSRLQSKVVVGKPNFEKKKNRGKHCQFHSRWKKTREFPDPSHFQQKSKGKGKITASVNHITVEENPETESDSDSSSIDDSSTEDEPKPAPDTFEEGGQATVDELKELNLGTEDDPRPVFVSALLTPEEEVEYFHLLREYKDVFAWSYKEMPGLDPKVAVHHLATRHGVRPIKQSQRRFRPELIPQIETEVNKLIDAGFIREVKYPTWIANIVPVRKKNGQLRICVDFRDLNKSCPKDDFPLPITELMVDATTGYETLSFMDGFSGYNQIRMNPKDEELTAFRTPKGIYCYKVMPFGLKNAGATYQRAMQKIFDDVLHKKVECYVDDLVVKSRKRSDHLRDLREVFERLRKYQLKMNPLKCAFGVTSGKFLGFVVKHRGIEIDQSKIQAIRNMPEPSNLHELKSLQGRLAYIRRFISNLAGRCHPFSRLMKKNVPFEWDEACQNAFQSIKKYLLHPPVLTAPIPGKPLLLYISAQEQSLGVLLAQNNDDGKETALYYLSRTLVGAELNYSPIEKICLALIFAVKKLRHYMLSHIVYLISKADPLKYIMTRSILSGRLAKWALLLSEFEVIFVSQKAVKGQALADFLADHPIPADWKLSEDFPDEEVFYIGTMPSWKLFFDGAARKYGAGAGIIFVTPQEEVLPYSFTLTRSCSNNVAEYQALIIGLQMALDMQLSQLEIYGDSQLVVNQVMKQYSVFNTYLVPYFRYATSLMEQFDEVTIEFVPRNENRYADALASLATVLANSEKEIISVHVCKRWVIPPLPCVLDEAEVGNISVVQTVKEDWRQPLIDFLEYGKLPDDSRHKTEIRRRAPRFIHYKDTLYRRSFDGVFLRCLGEEEVSQVLEEAHSGVCGAHQSGPKLHFRVKRMGYYWPTMVKDCMDYARKCEACQFHANFIHQPPEPLHPTVASWPFDAWGLDVVGPLTPKSSAGHLYILAATDYFSKWAEAIPLKEVKKENVVDFIRTNIIYRYGVPRYIITDNGKPFYNKLMNQLCAKFSFVQHNSSMYNAAANGLAEAFNKTLCNLLKKVVSKSKRDWHEKVGEALWAYRTTHRTPTQATPYSLVYGVEAVLPLECQIPSLRIAIQEGLTSEENAKLRLQELEALDEKRLETQQRLECYQARLSRAFNKKVRPRSFQVGDMVLSIRRPIVIARKTGGKFTSKWDGPYVVTEVYSNGAYKIVDKDGLRIGPINGKFLKRFYS